jgi:hypothetical protein
MTCVPSPDTQFKHRNQLNGTQIFANQLFFAGDDDIKEIGESMDSFEDKLDDIFVRLDNLATLCSQSYDEEPPFGESSYKDVLLLTF